MKGIVRYDYNKDIRIGQWPNKSCLEYQKNCLGNQIDIKNLNNLTRANFMKFRKGNKKEIKQKKFI